MAVTNPRHVAGEAASGNVAWVRTQPAAIVAARMAVKARKEMMRSSIASGS
jgi:hypothetical protein